MRVEVYTKPACSLCDRAKDSLTRAQEKWAFELVEHSLYERADWFARYRYDVPVVFIGGVERLKLSFTDSELEAALCSGHHREEIGVFPHADRAAADQRSVTVRHARSDSGRRHRR